jgi:D-alanyl-D-alanine carboxypeptidase/D-alanyl-D-alanine-endopeptidase (penicillin-binding protein 4)
VFWFPVLCIVLMVLSLQRASAANRNDPDRPLVAQPAPVTPVLSARRLPNLVALPSQAQQLLVPVQDLLVQTPTDTTCLSIFNSRGVPVYLHNPTLSLTPASTMKILTGYAALTLIGPDTKYATVVATDAANVNGVVQGNVWLVGSGDPVLTTEDYAASFAAQPQVHTRIESLVDQLKAAGISRIRGNVIADETRFDAVRYPPGWPRRFVNNAEAGPESALVLNRGFTSYPPAGQVWSGSGARTVSTDPARDAVGRFVTLIRAAGIQVDGKVDVGPVPQSPTVLAKVESPPLRDIVGQMLKMSDNSIAELVAKEIGVRRAAKGSTQGGTEAITAILTERGFTGPGMAIVDGSGLDPTNKVPCSVLSAVLLSVGRQSDLVNGLAVAGVSGTLSDRLAGTPASGRVVGKTGTLDNASALAGYVDTTKGDTVGFAMIVNGGDGEAWKGLEDQLALTLLDYPAGPDIAEIGPRPPG